MALTLDYNDKEQHTVFNNAYARILNGNFDARNVNIVVGVYASKAAREAEKNREALALAVEKSMEEVANAQKALHDSELALAKVSEDHFKASEKFGQGRIQQKDLDKSEEVFKSAKKETNKKLAEFQAKLDADLKLREQLQALPTVRLLDVKNFTFERTHVDKIDFNYLYNRLKKTEDFEGAVDAQEV